MLYEKKNYTANIDYLNNMIIYELDIQQANISILYAKNLLDKEVYEYLSKAERHIRQVYIGHLQKDPSISQALSKGIIEYKKLLFEANMLKDYEILSIKNDAVYIIGRLPQETEFGLIKFICKNMYTGFYKVLNLEIYYSYNAYNQTEILHIKGIDDKKLFLHHNWFYQYLKDLFYTIQVDGIEKAMRLHKIFYLRYISRSLPIEYYRRFASDCDYQLLIHSPIGSSFMVSESLNIDIVDISHNLSILVELQKILINIYTTHNR